MLDFHNVVLNLIDNTDTKNFKLQIFYERESMHGQTWEERYMIYEECHKKNVKRYFMNWYNNITKIILLDKENNTIKTFRPKVIKILEEI